VFVDVVESAQLANELGNEAMNQVRRTLFARGRELTRTCDGYPIKTIGDAMMVAFRTAVQALDFALALQTESIHPQLELRSGIHIGPVDIEEEDAYGAMVNLTARIESLSQSGEIWISDEAKRHIDQERAKRHLHLEWGRHPKCLIKGFPGIHTLWSLRIDRESVPSHPESPGVPTSSESTRESEPSTQERMDD